MQMKSFILGALLTVGLLAGCGGVEGDAEQRVVPARSDTSELSGEDPKNQTHPFANGMHSTEDLNESFPRCIDISGHECSAPQQWRETCVHFNGTLGQCYCADERWYC